MRLYINNNAILACLALGALEVAALLATLILMAVLNETVSPAVFLWLVIGTLIKLAIATVYGLYAEID